MKTIEIIVSPDGQTKVETFGFTGSECQQASRSIENALGNQAGEVLKADFYTREQNPSSVENGQGESH